MGLKKKSKHKRLHLLIPLLLEHVCMSIANKLFAYSSHFLSTLHTETQFCDKTIKNIGAAFAFTFKSNVGRSKPSKAKQTNKQKIISKKLKCDQSWTKTPRQSSSRTSQAGERHLDVKTASFFHTIGKEAYREADHQKAESLLCQRRKHFFFSPFLFLRFDAGRQGSSMRCKEP